MGIATNDDHDLQTTSDDIEAESNASLTGSPVVRVVTAVADELGLDPVAMDPLYETIDTDALDRLLESDATLEVVFEHDGHAIEIESDGTVAVDGRESPTRW